MKEIDIQDIDFLYGCANPTIIMINQNATGYHIKAKELSIQNKEFVKVLHIFVLLEIIFFIC